MNDRDRDIFREHREYKNRKNREKFKNLDQDPEKFLETGGWDSLSLEEKFRRVMIKVKDTPDYKIEPAGEEDIPEDFTGHISVTQNDDPDE